MLRHFITFLLGIYVGQEYGKFIPNVKNKTVEYISEFKKTELYKKMEQDFGEYTRKK